MQLVSLQSCPLVAQSSFLCGASSCVDTICISLEGQSPCRCSLSLVAEPHSMQVQPSPTHGGSVCVDMVLCNGTTCGFRLLMADCLICSPRSLRWPGPCSLGSTLTGCCSLCCNICSYSCGLNSALGPSPYSGPLSS